VVNYHGLARRYVLPSGFLMRPLLNGGTLGAPHRYSQPFMNVQAWIETELWADGYFCPSRLGSPVELFRSGVSRPLVASLVDGCRGTPTWSSYSSLSPTDSLFRRVRGLVRRYGASWFYITDPDNALSVFHWSKVIDADAFGPWELAEFERNRAVEGGCSHLGIAFHSKQGLLVFSLCDAFVIDSYGSPEFMTELKEALARPSK